MNAQTDVKTTKQFPLVSMALGVALFTTSIITTPLLADFDLSNIDGDQCSYDLDYDIKVSRSSITFTDDSGKQINIDEDNHLSVNGNRQILSSEQQAFVDDYADGIRVLIPEVKALATEAINIGVTAAGMALSTLLGEDDPDYSRFNAKISSIANLITDKINADEFDSKAFNSDFDDGFGDDLEAVVEEAVEEITPRLMAKVMTAALSGDSNGISAIEVRAQDLERDIEEYIEPQAEAIEARAKELCTSVADLDRIEDQMVSSGLDMMDLIVEDS